MCIRDRWNPDQTEEPNQGEEPIQEPEPNHYDEPADTNYGAYEDTDANPPGAYNDDTGSPQGYGQEDPYDDGGYNAQDSYDPPKDQGYGEGNDDVAAGLREELRMEQEDRLALEQELKQARVKIEALKEELSDIKNRGNDMDLKENERNTVLEAKGKLEDDLLKLKAGHGEEQQKRQKAEQDLTFEQEVRRAAAATRDEAEKLLTEEKQTNTMMQDELQSVREQLAAAEEARRQTEEAGAKDRETLERREDDIMALRIELGEKEAEVRHASKMENLQCSVEYEKLRSELEWKTKMLTSECDDLEGRLEDSEARRRKMEQAVMTANGEMRLRKQEGEHMMRMLDQVLQRTEGARSTEDSKLRELSAVRESVQALKEEANKQLSAMDNMREVNMAEFDGPKPVRRRRFDNPPTPPGHSPPRQNPMNRSPGGAGRRGGGANAGFGAEIFDNSELDSQIRQIEDELTIKLPPLENWQQESSPGPGQQAPPAGAKRSPPKRGAGQARGAKAPGRQAAGRR
eukprot:TRINITY_DN450_c0_g1_i1.p1 TRINITY_DN450_c0_g1~~TRINITY_DN450_c0_g1_i1.p1  ORF type:complete len:515 (+),score=200.93 TRINITY_DN450_c0_g1_i1:137-1681(+)